MTSKGRMSESKVQSGFNPYRPTRGREKGEGSSLRYREGAIPLSSRGRETGRGSSPLRKSEKVKVQDTEQGGRGSKPSVKQRKGDGEKFKSKVQKREGDREKVRVQGTEGES